MTSRALALAFAAEQGYDDVRSLGSWQGYDAYEPVFHGDEPAVVGLPLMILVRDGQVRMSTPEEAFAQMDGR